MRMSHEGVLKYFFVNAYIMSSIFLRNIHADIEAIGYFRVTIYRKEGGWASSEHENIVTNLDE